MSVEKSEKATITKCVFKSPNKNSCRPAAAADKCGWIFRGNPFSKYPSQKINGYPRKNIQHPYWVIYHFILKKGELARMEPARKLVEKG